MSGRSDERFSRFARKLERAGSIAWMPVIAYFGALLGFARSRIAVFGFPLDDAWIHRVYARSFASLQGFAYNLGQQEAGSTSPLWAIVTAPAHWLEGLGTDYVVLAVKATGVALGLAGILALQRIGARLTGSRLAAAAAATLFAVKPRLLFAALSGMETPLLVAVLLGACLALIEKRYFLLLLLMSLAPVTRPGALVLLPFSLMGLVPIWRSNRRTLTKILACLIPVIPEALWVAFCFHTTGHVFPNTYYMKAHSFSVTFKELDVGLRALVQHGFLAPWLLLLGFCAVLVFGLARRKVSGGPFAFLLAAPVVYLLAVVGSRDVFLGGYYWTRWVDPASLLIAADSCIGLGILLTMALDGVTVPARALAPKGRPTIRILASSATLVLLLASAPIFTASFRDRRDHLSSDSRAIDVLNVQMGKWIERNTPVDAVVAVNDAGAIRYFGRRRTIDLAGLNDSGLAFRRVSAEEAVAGADWLAIFPLVFPPGALRDYIISEFEPRHTITIPVEEYTICYAPSQTRKVAFERRAPRTRSR